MKRYRIHLIGLGIVAVWAVFSYAYLGVEDGSSGLGLLGWIQAAFFLPGSFLVLTLKGSHSNADLPLMAAMSGMTYSFLAVVIGQAACWLRKPRLTDPAKRDAR